VNCIFGYKSFKGFVKRLVSFCFSHVFSIQAFSIVQDEVGIIFSKGLYMKQYTRLT
jgi:hypothetical protein